MKDKEVNLEDTESSNTLGGTIRYTLIHQSHWCSYRGGSVVWTDTPVWMCDRETRGRRRYGFVRAIRYTWIYQSRRLSHRAGCVAWTDAPACMCERGQMCAEDGIRTRASE